METRPHWKRVLTQHQMTPRRLRQRRLVEAAAAVGIVTGAATVTATVPAPTAASAAVTQATVLATRPWDAVAPRARTSQSSR